MTPIFEKNGIKIYQDTDRENPRVSFDTFGTIVAFHKKYDLGDKPQEYTFENFNSWNDLKAQIVKDHNPAVILPVYMLDHSGICISTESFNDPWDSGQIGFIYAKDNIPGLDLGLCLETTEQWLQEEVKLYNDFLTGNVFGYEKPDGDSCWGFFGYTPEELADECCIRKCTNCGTRFTPDEADETLCPDCDREMRCDDCMELSDSLNDYHICKQCEEKEKHE